MPASKPLPKPTAKEKKTASKPAVQTQSGKPKAASPEATKSEPAKLDILFGGPLLFVPSVHEGLIGSVDVYSPSNGHPVGAIFLPGVWFSDAELNDPECERWPVAESFTYLDPHSYAIHVEQTWPGKGESPLPGKAIPATNHKVKPGRKLSGNWEVAITIHGRLSGWTSHRLIDIQEGVFGGSDAPTAASVANLHRLTYPGITGAEFYGLSKEPKEYLSANAAKGGSLIVMGEIPYQSTLLHERGAVDALARLAGLNLHLLATAPLSNRTRLMHHTTPCVYSVVLADSE